MTPNELIAAEKQFARRILLDHREVEFRLVLVTPLADGMHRAYLVDSGGRTTLLEVTPGKLADIDRMSAMLAGRIGRRVFHRTEGLSEAETQAEWNVEITMAKRAAEPIARVMGAKA
ncbi:MAG: hypothetical protein AAGA92_15695 [Planctomycetota bacterium]